MSISVHSQSTYPPNYPNKPAQQRTSLDRDSSTDGNSAHYASSHEHLPLRSRPQTGDSLYNPLPQNPGQYQHDPMPHSTQPAQQTQYPHPYAHDAPPKELPALQVNGNLDASENLDPITADDPASYELLRPAPDSQNDYSLEKRSQTLFSREHLQVIFADPNLLLKFTTFLGIHRPQSVPLLVYYLDALKALRTLHYANAILEGLDPISELEFTAQAVTPTSNPALEARANNAFEHLVKEELPAFITHTYIQIVSSSISSRITGSLAPHLRDTSEGLAEVFCLTDPARADNPIVFASEEFNRTTQYGMTYILGRNCRFLQGPWTNPLSVRRIRDAVSAGKQHQEVFLNYRRDGSPFMNLLMIAPLCDSRGTIRYFIGAQVDVSGLVKECAELESLQRLLEIQARGEEAPSLHRPDPAKNDELRELAEMLSQGELSTVRKWGGRMHREVQDSDADSMHNGHSRLLIKDPNTLTPPLDGLGGMTASGKLSGIYQHYLLVRPYPSLRILFASPSQRVPGILQSPFLNKIGGSPRVRDELAAAFSEGRGVTARVRWVSSSKASMSGPDGDDGNVQQQQMGRNKWIHCTPLVGGRGEVGVWMVVIVDDEREKEERRWRNGGGGGAVGSFGRMAPPVPSSIASSTDRDRDFPPPREGSRTPAGMKRNGFVAQNGDANGHGVSNGHVNGHGNVNGHTNGNSGSAYTAYGYAVDGGGVYDGSPHASYPVANQRHQAGGGSQAQSSRDEGSVGSRSLTSLRID